MCDLQFDNLGSIISVIGISAKGCAWLLDSCGADDIHGYVHVWVEHRYLADIVLGARADGLICNG